MRGGLTGRLGRVSAMPHRVETLESAARNRRVNAPASSTAVFSPSTVADSIIARMTVAPSTARRKAMIDFISTLATSGIWAKIDGLYVAAQHTQQAGSLNWKFATPTYDLPSTGGVFTADQGIVGGSLTGGQVVAPSRQDNIHLAGYSSVTIPQQGAAGWIGAISGPSLGVAPYNNNLANEMDVYLNTQAGGYISSSLSSPGPTGLYVGVRTSSTAIAGLQISPTGTVQKFTGSIASNGPPTSAISFGNSSNQNWSIGSWGAALTDADCATYARACATWIAAPK